MNNPAIVISTYNRIISIQRLLHSIGLGNYEGFDHIHLIISIDGGSDNNFEINKIVQQFKWNFGTKTIISHKENLGLKNHILFCGNLTNKYDSIILLEDDIFVSRNFYQFAYYSLQNFKDDPKICGISLFSYFFDELTNSIFKPINDGSDCYFAQVPSSWGEIWNKKQWHDFITYYDSHQYNPDKLIPDVVNRWGINSWKKEFFYYMIKNDLFFVYPYLSFSTNFSDCGVHIETSHEKYQVELENYHNKTFIFTDLQNSNIVYDSFLEIKAQCLINLGSTINNDTLIDIKGKKDIKSFSNKYILTSKKTVNPISQYASNLIPLELNIIKDLHSLQSEQIYYGELQLTDIGTNTMNTFAKMNNASYIKGAQSVLSMKEYKIGKYLIHPHKLIQRILNSKTK